MGINYKVVLTAKARDEIEEIYNYISKSLMAEKAANNLMSKIHNNILMLEEMPKSKLIKTKIH